YGRPPHLARVESRKRAARDPHERLQILQVFGPLGGEVLDRFLGFRHAGEAIPAACTASMGMLGAVWYVDSPCGNRGRIGSRSTGTGTSPISPRAFAARSPAERAEGALRSSRCWRRSRARRT